MSLVQCTMNQPVAKQKTPLPTVNKTKRFKMIIHFKTTLPFSVSSEEIIIDWTNFSK